MAEDSFVEDSFVEDKGDSFVEDSFVADVPEKKKSVSKSSSVDGTSASTKDVSPYAPQSILKDKENKAALQPKIKEETRTQFLNNPAFSPSNPNSEKNKEIYFKQLESSGHDVSALKKYAKDLDSYQAMYAENMAGVSANPSDINSSYKAAVGAIGIGKYDQAIELFKNTLAHNKQGSSDMMVQDELAMNTPTSKLGADNPSNSLYGIGYAYLNKKDYKSAIDYFNQALSEDPENANAQKGLASAKFAIGDTVGARVAGKSAEVLEQKAQSDPSRIWYLRLGRKLKVKEKSKESPRRNGYCRYDY